MKPFPISYFQTIFKPVEIYRQRKRWRWYQIILIWLFLVALLVIPLSYRVGLTQSVELDTYMPEALKLIDDDFIREVNKLSSSDESTIAIEDAMLVKEDDKSYSVITNDKSKAVDDIGDRVSVILSPDCVVIRESEDLPIVEVSYLDSKKLIEASDPASFKAELSQQWFDANRINVLLNNLMTIYFVVFISSLFLVLGSAAFLQMMDMGDNYNVGGFKGGIGLTLNLLGIPSIICLVVGFFIKDPAVFLILHGASFIIMLFWVFYKTKFSEDYLDSLEEEKKKEQEQKALE